MPTGHVLGRYYSATPLVFPFLYEYACQSCLWHLTLETIQYSVITRNNVFNIWQITKPYCAALGTVRTPAPREDATCSAGWVTGWAWPISPRNSLLIKHWDDLPIVEGWAERWGVSPVLFDPPCPCPPPLPPVWRRLNLGCRRQRRGGGDDAGGIADELTGRPGPSRSPRI